MEDIGRPIFNEKEAMVARKITALLEKMRLIVGDDWEQHTSESTTD